MSGGVRTLPRLTLDGFASLYVRDMKFAGVMVTRTSANVEETHAAHIEKMAMENILPDMTTKRQGARKW